MTEILGLILICWYLQVPFQSTSSTPAAAPAAAIKVAAVEGGDSEKAEQLAKAVAEQVRSPPSRRRRAPFFTLMSTVRSVIWAEPQN